MTCICKYLLFFSAASFPVEIISTPLSESLHLVEQYPYVLQIDSHSLYLQDKITKTLLYQWSFSCIRKYGFPDRTFQMEVGRRCASGEGIFTFAVEDLRTLQLLLKSKISAFSSKKKTLSTKQHIVHDDVEKTKEKTKTRNNPDTLKKELSSSELNEPSHREWSHQVYAPVKHSNALYRSTKSVDFDSDPLPEIESKKRWPHCKSQAIDVHTPSRDAGGRDVDIKSLDEPSRRCVGHSVGEKKHEYVNVCYWCDGHQSGAEDSRVYEGLTVEANTPDNINTAAKIYTGLVRQTDL